MDSKRFLTGLIIGFIALFAILAGGIWLTLLVLVIVFYASKEYTAILRHKGFLPSLKIILASSLLFAALAYFDRFDLIPLAFTLSALMAFMWVLFRGRQPYIANVATTVLGFVYCGWFPLHMIFLRSIGEDCTTCAYPAGAGYAVLLLFSVLVTDTFCYFAGSKFGKHKLAPVISPNKSIEGAIGGTVMCLLLGLLIAAFAQIGDLCESLIKRDAGVKDSSNVLPGHGGFLDRTDSYILTIPVVYYYLQYFVETNIIMDLFKGLF